LSRVANDILKASAESHERLNAVVWLYRARSAAAERQGSHDDDMGATSRRLG
jgi:hypothetical protein